MVSKAEFDNIWKKPVIKIGVVTVLIPTFMCFLPNLFLYIKFGVFPPVSVALKSWGMIAAIFGAFYIVEPISYS